MTRRSRSAGPFAWPVLAALALGGAGCGLSLTGAAIGLVVLDEDDDPVVNAAPTGFVDTPTGLVNDIIRITYRVADAEGDAVNVSVRYSTDGGATFAAAPATHASGVAGAEGLTGLATAPGGVPHTFHWNSFVDLRTAGLTDNFPQVRIRLDVSQADGQSAVTLTTGTFAVWNRYIASVAGGLSSPFPGTIVGPGGLVRAPDGDLIVADPAGHQVVRVDAQTGARTVVAGTGEGGYNGDNVVATTAKLNRPTDVALDAAGDLFIADSGNSRVRRVSATSGFISTLVGGTSAGFAGDGGDPTQALLASAESVDVEPNGNVWIADTGNNRIRMVNRTGATVAFTYWDAGPNNPVTQNVAPNTIDTVAGPGFIFFNDGDRPTQTTLNRPKGLRLVSLVGTPLGYVFCDSGNNRVRAVALTSPVTGPAATTAIFGTAVINGTIQTIAGGGSPPAGSVGDGTSAITAALREPTACSSWLGLGLCIADTGQNRIRVVDSTGTINSLVGTGGSGFSGDGGIPQLATLAGPKGVLVDSSGNIFTSDTGNGRVRMTNGQSRHGVWGASASDVVAVGGTGSVLRANGTALALSSIGAPDLLAAVAGSGAADVVAVGFDGVIHRWNGTAWASEASGTTNVLTAVWAMSATNQLAVGQGGLALRWNGSAWATESTGSTTWLEDVWAADANNVFVVGSGGTVLYHNGTAWSATPTSGTTVDLHGVFGDSASSAWAVGDGGVIRYWSGSSWGNQSSGVTANLRAVWVASATDGWAVGDGGVITRLTSTGWAAATSPTNASFYAVFGTASNNVFAVGESDVVCHWNGSAWTQLSTASSVTYAGVTVNAVTIQSLTAPPSGLPAALGDPRATIVDGAGNVYVSSFGTHQVLRVDAITRAVTIVAGTGRAGFAGDSGQAGPGTALTTGELRGVWGPTASDVFTVGGGGAILRWNGSAWAAMTVPVTTDLRAVHGTSSTNVFACGVGGVVLQWDGVSWRALASGTARDLNGVFAAGSNDVFFVGSNGTILHWNGVAFTNQTAGLAAPPIKTFRGVWGTSSSDVFAVGDGAFGNTQGPIWHWNGTTWQVQLANNLVNLWSIWGTSSTNAWAVGDIIGIAIIYKLTGSTWAGESSSAPWSQRAVFGRDAADVIAAGEYGGLQLRPTPPATWSAVNTSTTVGFRAGIAFSGGPAFLVGEGGTIYQQAAAGGAFTLQVGQAMLDQPLGLVLAGNVLFIADAGNNRLRAVNLGTSAATVWTGGNTVTIAGGSIRTVAGGGSAAGPGFGDGGAATAAVLAYPSGLSRDPQTGDLYLADALHSRIRRIAANGTISAYAGTGTYGNGGDTGAATSATLSFPFGVTLNRIDASTIEVYIADTFNHRIRRVDNGGTINAFAGSGTKGWNGDNQTPLLTQFDTPTDVIVVGTDTWISDAGNHRIRRVSGTPAVVTTVAGTGSAGFNGDVKPGVNTDLSAADSCAYDAVSGAIFISDTGNNRVRRFRP